MLKDRGVAIVSTSGDAHARIIADQIKRRGTQCHILATDMISVNAASSAEWGVDRRRFIAKSESGKEVDVSELNVCWWRRVAQLQKKTNGTLPGLEQISGDAARHLFIGGFLSHFAGKYISHPQATVVAENKLLQLSLATKAGLRIPETIVSNNIKEIYEFGARFNRKLIAKSLSPLGGRMVDAVLLDISQLDEDEISAVPTIFQEFIDGSRHIRAIIFGKAVVLIEFSSDQVDWRRQVPTKMRVASDECGVCEKLLNLCSMLDLSMGVADLKVAKSGEMVFFEINPQGQFLFVEPYISQSIAEPFAEFLLAESS